MNTKIKEKEQRESFNTQKRLVEMEINKLTIEDKRNRRAILKGDVSHKRKNMIALLKNERNNLVTNLEVMFSERACQLREAEAKEITEYFNQKDHLDEELIHEKTLIKDIEERIRQVSKLKLPQKQIQNAVISDYGCLEKENKAVAKKEAMELRLNAERLQLSKVTTQNAELRGRIENQLKDRARFNQLYEDLILKLGKGKNILKDIIEEANFYQHKREETCRKIQALKDRDQADLKKRSEEIDDFKGKYSEEYVIAKYKARVAVQRTVVDESPDAVSEQQKNRNKEKEKLERLHGTLDVIKDYAEETNLLQLCDLIRRNDADNYSLLNYNNDLRFQIEALTEKTAELVRRLNDEEDFIHEREERAEWKRSELGRFLRDMQVEINMETEDMRTNQRVFQHLLEQTLELFKIMECDPLPLQQLLGSNEEVTEFNFQLYLSLIETRLMALLEGFPQTSGHIFVPYCPPVNTLSSFVSTIKPLHDDKKVITRPCPECEELRKKPVPED